MHHQSQQLVHLAGCREKQLLQPQHECPEKETWPDDVRFWTNYSDSMHNRQSGYEQHKIITWKMRRWSVDTRLAMTLSTSFSRSRIRAWALRLSAAPLQPETPLSTHVAHLSVFAKSMTPGRAGMRQILQV